MMGAPTAPAVYLAKAKVQFETYKSIYGSKALHRLVLSHIYLAPSLNSMGKKKNTSPVVLLPLTALFALVPVLGIIHTLLTPVFRL